MKTKPNSSCEEMDRNEVNASGRPRWVEVVDQAIESARKQISQAEQTVIKEPKQPKNVGERNCLAIDLQQHKCGK